LQQEHQEWKKNKYGNTEDFVLSIKFVTCIGTFDLKNDAERKSVGPDLRHIILGSEGTLGVITECVVKIAELPETLAYGSVIFKDYESGCNFLHELATKGLAPSSVRLLDNIMFKFGQSLKIKSDSHLEHLVEWAKKHYITKIAGFDLNKLCAATFLFEGSKEEVKKQEKLCYQIAKKFGGLPAGAKGGQNGYMLTYVIAYLRDYGMAYYFLGESFETFVPWKQVVACSENVKKRIIDEGKKRGVGPFDSWATCRVTQTYKSGACIYFYIGFNFHGIKNAVKVFSEMEECARDEVLLNGGTLSHHHGVGKLRRKWMSQCYTDLGIEILTSIKTKLDPKNVFGNGNMGLTKAKISISDSIIGDNEIESNL